MDAGILLHVGGHLLGRRIDRPSVFLLLALSVAQRGL